MLPATRTFGHKPFPLKFQLDRLIRMWNDMVGLDYVARALGHLGDNASKDLLAAWEKRRAACSRATLPAQMK